MCEAPPLQGVVEYEHLLELQLTESRVYCIEALSQLRLPAVAGHPERRCLDGLDDLIATYQRSCAALDVHIDTMND